MLWRVVCSCRTLLTSAPDMRSKLIQGVSDACVLVFRGMLLLRSAQLPFPHVVTVTVAAWRLQEGKIDKRHGDPDAGGKNSGQKAVRYEQIAVCALIHELNAARMCGLCMNPVKNVCLVLCALGSAAHKPRDDLVSLCDLISTPSRTGRHPS